MAPRTTTVVVRLCVVASLVAAATAVVVVVLGSERQQRFRLVAVNAGQLVKGNLVKVGGVRAGVVERIDLGRRNEAVIHVRVNDGDLLPLHQGTRAEIRLSSLSSVAGRYVSLLPGPNDRPALRDGATVPATDVSVPVEIDQVLSTFNADTRRAVRAALRGSAAIYRGRSTQANAALAALNPALTELAATAREVGRDDARLERFLVEAAAVMDVVGQRSPEVDAGLQDAAATASELAGNRRRLQAALVQAPRALRHASGTLTRLAAAGQELGAALRDAKPVAPRAARLLRTLDGLLPQARPALAAAERLLPLTQSTLRTFPALGKAAEPAVTSAGKALADAGPLVAGARPYVPDIVHGFTSGFGGQTFTYYDANGHYGRIRPMVYAGSTQTAGLLSSLLQTSVAGPAEQRYLLRRCPGAATDPAPDGSNPFPADDVPCDPAQVP